ncbi:hypothetical protein M433DRAFT_10494, partial [Acidomyces richmondensis BFW]
FLAWPSSGPTLAHTEWSLRGCKAGGSLAALEIGFCRFSPALARWVRTLKLLGIGKVGNRVYGVVWRGAVLIFAHRPTNATKLAGPSPEPWTRAGGGERAAERG